MGSLPNTAWSSPWKRQHPRGAAWGLGKQSGAGAPVISTLTRQEEEHGAKVSHLLESPTYIWAPDWKSPGLLQTVCGPPSWAASPRALSPR